MVFMAEKNAAVPRGAMTDWSTQILDTIAAMLHSITTSVKPTSVFGNQFPMDTTADDMHRDIQSAKARNLL